MSSETINPIDPSRFALALEALPLDALHAKAAEIHNSTLHLRHSNNEMLPFAEQGDQDCKDAMLENLAVIGRMNERVGLIRAEVERRGQRWSEGEVEDKEQQGGGDGEAGGLLVNGAAATTNGVGHAASTVSSAVSGEVQQPRAPSGRLTDEELRRQLEARIGGGGEDGDGDDDGVHL
ncbi:hypothetical protein LTR85_006133 [Meristemomyces frigidus]|nr:hypothetical protein LTR85_006133 [Meristemomyces frigidus]